MALPLSIPTVTNDDLITFHHHAFGTAPPPNALPHFPTTSPGPKTAFNDTQFSHAQHDDGDDELGYYPDRAKRTLTDQQIAMFRHSEVYGIVRARQLKRENEDFGGEEEEAEEAPAEDSTRAVPEEESGVTPGARDGIVNDDATRQSTSRLKRRKLNRQRNMQARGGDVPSRRVIREMDKPVGGEEGGELEY